MLTVIFKTFTVRLASLIVYDNLFSYFRIYDDITSSWRVISAAKDALWGPKSRCDVTCSRAVSLHLKIFKPLEMSQMFLSNYLKTIILNSSGICLWEQVWALIRNDLVVILDYQGSWLEFPLRHIMHEVLSNVKLVLLSQGSTSSTCEEKL